MIAKDIPTTAPHVSTVWPTLDRFKADIKEFSEANNISETLLLCCLREWCERQLQTPIDLPNH